MAIQIDEFSETRAAKESLVETKYLGTNPFLLDSAGQAYLNLQDNQWFYRKIGDQDWWRVKSNNLSCNTENGWIKCRYVGSNPRPKKLGKARYDEEALVWYYKPAGETELYRVKNDSSLEFIRDKDVV